MITTCRHKVKQSKGNNYPFAHAEVTRITHFSYLTILKKTIAILFLSIYLLATTEAHQLFKLPVVFQHFVEHQQEDSNISFLKFLDMHYMHGSPKDADYDRDMQLPFKKSADCVSVMASAAVPNQLAIVLEYPVFFIQQEKIELDHNKPLSSCLSNIWQPPKYC